jgi:hypothetical protein
MDPSIRTGKTLVQDSIMWRGNGGRPTVVPDSIAVDRSAFDLVTAFPNAFIPSGVAVVRHPTTGLYVPYGGAPSEIQTVGLGAASAGTLTIGFDGETTPAVNFDDTSTEVQAFINGLSNVASGDITVTGGPFPGVLTFTWGGQYIGQNVPQLVVTPTGLTGGTVTVTTTQAGGGAAATTAGRKGLLYTAVEAPRGSTGDLGAALFEAGVVLTANLPVGHGVDEAFKAATPHILYR